MTKFKQIGPGSDRLGMNTRTIVPTPFDDAAEAITIEPRELPSTRASDDSLVPPDAFHFARVVFSVPFKPEFDDMFGSTNWDRNRQSASGTLNSTFNVYIENGDVPGRERFIVLCTQDLVANPAPMFQNDADARGWFHALIETQLRPIKGILPTKPVPSPAPLLPADGAHWVSSSPATVNQTITQTTTVTDSNSFTWGLSMTGGADSKGIMGQLGLNIGGTHAQQVSNSETRTILEWGVNETTRAADNQCSWAMHQQDVFDPLVDTDGNYKGWVDNCFDGRRVKKLPDLSTNALQHHNTSVWSFDPNKLADGDAMVVKFYGRLSLKYYCLTHRVMDKKKIDWQTRAYASIYELDLAKLLREAQARRG